MDMIILNQSVYHKMMTEAMSAITQDHGPELWRAQNQADHKKNNREKSNRESRDLLKGFFR